MLKYAFVAFLLLITIHDAYGESFKVPRKGYIACEKADALKTIANMLSVAEVDIASIYFKRYQLKGECVKLRAGETVTLNDGTWKSEVVEIVRNGKNYFMLFKVVQFP